MIIVHLRALDGGPAFLGVVRGFSVSEGGVRARGTPKHGAPPSCKPRRDRAAGDTTRLVTRETGRDAEVRPEGPGQRSSRAATRSSALPAGRTVSRVRPPSPPRTRWSCLRLSATPPPMRLRAPGGSRGRVRCRRPAGPRQTRANECSGRRPRPGRVPGTLLLSPRSRCAMQHGVSGQLTNQQRKSSTPSPTLRAPKPQSGAPQRLRSDPGQMSARPDQGAPHVAHSCVRRNRSTCCANLPGLVT